MHEDRRRLRRRAARLLSARPLRLNNIIARRQQSIMRAFPDALDLLLICVESGMSIEAAFNRVAAEDRHAVGRTRRRAWR